MHGLDRGRAPLGPEVMSLSLNTLSTQLMFAPLVTRLIALMSMLMGASPTGLSWYCSGQMTCAMDVLSLIADVLL